MSASRPDAAPTPPRPAPTFTTWGRRARTSLLSGAVLIALALGFGWLFEAASVPLPVEAVSPESVAGFPGNDPAAPLLVDALWLAARQERDGAAGDLVVLDLSNPRRYAAEHVPGAVHGWWQDTMSLDDDVYGERIEREEGRRGYRRLFQTLGIGPETTVVIYDDDANRYAARFVWLLRFLGFERAMVLDGGLAAWKGAGFAASDVPATAPAARPVEGEQRLSRRITTGELVERLDDPSLVIIDARSPAEAADDLNGTLRVGAIPGAIWLPWQETVRDVSGRLRSPAELAARFQAAGVTPEQEVVVYGRFGVETGQPWLVLSLLGYEDVRVYDAGWATWASSPDRPITPLPSAPAGSLVATPDATPVATPVSYRRSADARG